MNPLNSSAPSNTVADADAAAAAQRQAMTGALLALGAFLSWGANPLYFRAVSFVPAPEVFAHRIVWSGLILAALLSATGTWRWVVRALANRKTALALLASTSILALNWYIYISAVDHARVVETSLGYFINPLVNVLLGRVFLAERLTRPQKVAVGLAVVGVMVPVLARGSVPWIALVLACSFSFYGLIRKVIRVDALPGLFVETVLLAPFALAYLAYIAVSGTNHFTRADLGSDGLLMLSGVVTAVPLLWFASAARRLRYSTLGFFQYLSPSCQLLLAVFAFGEPFTAINGASFACIWSALAIVTLEALLPARLIGRREPTVP